MVYIQKVSGGMNMTHTVYVKLDEITELTHKDILLKDVAQVYCRDQNIQNKCSVCRIMTVRSDEAHRYVMSALDVTKKLEALDPGLEVEHMGKDRLYHCRTSRPLLLPYGRQWCKTACICLISFFWQRSFAIMTFNKM